MDDEVVPDSRAFPVEEEASVRTVDMLKSKSLKRILYR